MVEPTNSEILKELKSIHISIDNQEARIENLERWKIAFDAADAAVSKYKQEHIDNRSTVNLAANSGGLMGSATNEQFLKILGSIIALLASIAAILFAIINYVVKG